MRRKHLTASIIFIVVIGAIAGKFVYSSMSQRPEFSQVSVQKSDLSETVRTMGLVKDETSADLSFEKGGRVIRMDVVVGNKVKAGQVLAKIDSSDSFAQYSQAQSQATAAQAVLDQYNQNLRGAKYELDKIQKDDTTNHEDKQIQQKKIDAGQALIASQRAAVQAAQNNVSYFSAQLAKTQIKAPFDGIVSAKNYEIGETVGASAPAISIIGNGGYQIEAYLSQIDVNKVKVGDAADITFKSFKDEGIISGHIASIDPSAEKQGGVPSYKVTLEFQAGDLLVKPDMEADVVIAIDQKEGVLAVPETAIIQKDDKKFVMVKNKEGQMLKQVETGIKGDNGMVEIVSGLNEGDSIVGISIS
jgi:RND family efflux transporter MFP subunit